MKVYCNNCKHFSRFRDTCWYKGNVVLKHVCDARSDGTYLHINNHYTIINKHNDCSWYKNKRKWWKFWIFWI